MMASFLKGLARAFTVPRATRDKIDSNPIVAALAPTLIASALNGVASQVDKNITDPTVNQAVKDAIAIGVSHALGVK